jgi:hypothetical protein
LALACATRSAPSVPPKFPSRPPSCDLTISDAAKPAVAAWDDLGRAETICHVTVSRSECLMRFRATACGMGGDLVYDFPKQPLRPSDQAILLRGRVAHRRVAPP